MRNKFRTIMVLGMALGTFLSANAETLDFDTFLSSALENSYQLKLSKIDSKIARKGIEEARAAYFPTLQGYAITERYNDLTDGKKQMTAVGNEIMLNRDYYQDATGIGLNYNLFDFGIRKRNFEIAKAEDKQKETLLLKNTRDLKLDVVDLYGETLILYKQIKVKNRMLALQKELLEMSKRLRKAGEFNEIQVVDYEIAISETETELTEYNNSFSKKLVEMSYYTGQKYDVNDVEISDFPENTTGFQNVSDTKKETDETIEGSVEETREIIFNPEDSLEAKSYDLEILKKKKEYEIQKRVNLPKLSFDTRYSLYGSDPDHFFDAIGDISQRGLSFRLSTSFTMFDGLKNFNTVKKKKLEIEKAEVQKDYALGELKKKYEQVKLDAKNSELQEENNKKTLALVNKNLEMVGRLNKAGEIPKMECLKKELELLDKKQKLEESGVKNFVNGFKLKVLKENKNIGVINGK